MIEPVLIETSYLPCIDYFCAIRSYSKVCIEGWEFFEKQTARNRCFINSSQGVLMLNVPLEGRHGKVITKDVRVETGNKWRNTHWRTIESAYRKAPFFEFYADKLHSVLFKGHLFLLDLNLDLLSFCLQSLKSTQEISVTLSYAAEPTSQVDLRNRVLGGKSMAQTEIFKTQTYQQVFGSAFVSNLSLIDTLFCCGPDARAVVKTAELLET